MPRCCSCAPPEKFPPPITTATWVPPRTTSAICRATRWTTSGSSPTCPPPNISPPSLSTTRPYNGRAGDDGSPLNSAITLPNAPSMRAPSEAIAPRRHPHPALFAPPDDRKGRRRRGFLFSLATGGRILNVPPRPRLFELVGQLEQPALLPLRRREHHADG